MSSNHQQQRLSQQQQSSRSSHKQQQQQQSQQGGSQQQSRLSHKQHPRQSKQQHKQRHHHHQYNKDTCTTLHKMIEAASVGNKHGCTWEHVLEYLEAHVDIYLDDGLPTLMSGNNWIEPTKELLQLSPLKSSDENIIIPCPELADELLPDPETGQSILRIVMAMECLPTKILAAICHLSPQALRAVDPSNQNCLPLHRACRYPVSNATERVLEVLVAAYPLAIIHRDAKGRTPLHYLFMYHAEHRNNPDIVHLFCQTINNDNNTNNKLWYQIRKKNSGQQQHDGDTSSATQQQLPDNASTIPDTIHGCYPIMYAAAAHAQPAAMEQLLLAWPQSKHVVDLTHGRTAIHWYFYQQMIYCRSGLLDDDGDDDSTTDVFGEKIGPEGIMHGHHHHHEQSQQQQQQAHQQQVVELLLSSRVARTRDKKQQNTPLHSACMYWAAASSSSLSAIIDVLDNNNKNNTKLFYKKTVRPILQLLLNAYAGQVSARNAHGQTPIMVFFDTAAASSRFQQQQQQEAFLSQTVFAPPLELIQRLVDGGITTTKTTKKKAVAEIEDDRGRLPLHAALQVPNGIPTSIIEFLIQQHPASLVHVNDENWHVPLHVALSRHGGSTNIRTEIGTIRALLHTYEYAKDRTVIEGRLPMKMEDKNGQYPLHMACLHDASFEVLEILVNAYSRAALLPSAATGDLPIHCIVTDDLLERAVNAVVHQPLQQQQQSDENEEILATARRKIRLLLMPLLSEPETLQRACSKRGMLPLHIAVLFQAVEYPVLLRMLELHPASALQLTNPLVTSSSSSAAAAAAAVGWSALDMHEMVREATARRTNTANNNNNTPTENHTSLEQWHHIRELLFSFSPTLDSHRRRQDLLDRCVRIVIDEIQGSGDVDSCRSYHFVTTKDNEECPPDLEITHTVSAMEADFLRQQQQREFENKTKRIVTKAVSGGKRFARTTTTLNSQRRKPSSNSSTKGAHQASTSRQQKNQKSKAGYSIYDTEETGFDYDAPSYEDDDEDSDSLNSSDEGQKNNEEYYDSDGEDDMTANSSRFQGGGGSEGESSAQTGLAERKQLNRTRIRRYAQQQKRLSTCVEEKKEDAESRAVAVREKPGPETSYHRPVCFSEVGMRIWTFFVLYCDKNNPSDNYVHQLSEIVENLDFFAVQRLVSSRLPPYANNYIGESVNHEGLSFRDAASPKCRELIHKLVFFLGRYEFRSDSDILIYRSDDDVSVTVQAAEWLFTTEQSNAGNMPGVAEENIWATGEIPAELGVTFETRQRPVWIRFTKNATEYHREVQSRVALGIAVDSDVQINSHSGIVPILQHFNAYSTDRDIDITYKEDTRDDRFRELKLFTGKPCADRGLSILMDEYPFALVYPAPPHGSMIEMFFRGGAKSMDAIDVFEQVARTVTSMHVKGICHGDISIRSLVSSSLDHYWPILDLSSSVRFDEDMSYLGGIDAQGYAQFRTETLPPEMFARVSVSELKRYNSYWKNVEERFSVKIDRRILEPVADVNSGAMYVVKCHSVLATQEGGDVGLPYDLVPATASTDIWALGQLLFLFLTGQTMAKTSVRSGVLLDYGALHNFDASALVYSDIEDPLVQDLLLQCLSNADERKKLTVAGLLLHPLFAREGLDIRLIKKLAEKHQDATASHSRQLRKELAGISEREWLKEKTIEVHVWKFDLLERFYYSPSEIVHRLLPQQSKSLVPLSLVVLPFSLDSRIPNDNMLAEQMGLELLRLSKVSFFLSLLQDAAMVEPQRRWSSSDLLRDLGLSEEYFGTIESDVALLAATHVELFRSNPMAVAIKLVQQKVQNVLSLFEKREAFLYHVDEYSCTPVVDSPVVLVPEGRERMIQSGLFFTYLCSLHIRGVSQSLGGLARLFSGSDSVPTLWVEEMGGMEQGLNESSTIKELRILETALHEMHSFHLGDSVEMIHDYFMDADTRRHFGGLFRVLSADMCLWTSASQELQELASSYTFKDALDKHRASCS